MKNPTGQPYDLPALRASLETAALIGAGASLVLLPYEAVFPRRPNYQRWHYRVAADDRVICHLIVGTNLARVHEQAGKFFEACPDLICRPLLFWEQPDGMGYLCLEHFAGETLDEAVIGGRCSATQWLDQVQRAQRSLAASAKNSTQAELENEVRRLVEDACTFPGFSPVDATLIHEQAESVLIKQAPTDGLTTRWSNGDFIGRNLLINPAGELRLIDYEHAAPTHFWASDWIRLTRFSVLPDALDQSAIPELALENQPWQEVHLWLQNLAQLKEAEPGPAVDHHTAAVVRLLFDAIGRALERDPSHPSHSFLLDILRGQRVRRDAVAGRFRDQRSLEEKLIADLDHANYRLLAFNRRYVKQTATVRTGQGALVQQQLLAQAQQVEVARLQDALAQAQGHLDHFLKTAVAPGEITHGLDQTKSLQAPHGKISLSGWILGPTPEQRQARVRLDRGNVFDCQVGLHRPDVAAAHPGRPGALVSGFSLQAYVPAGLHIGMIEQRTSSTDWAPVCSISIVAGVSPLVVRLETPVPPSRREGSCSIGGWCFHPQEEIDSLSVRFGAAVATLQHGLARPDVGSSYPGNKAAGLSGYAGVLQLAAGRDDVIITATLRSGAIVQTILARDIVVPDEALDKAIEDLLVPAPRSTESVTTYRLNETLRFAHPDTIQPFLEEGWSDAEGNFRWAIGPTASVRLKLQADQQPRELRLLVIPLIVPGVVNRQRIDLDHPEGVVPGTVELTEGKAQEIVFVLPPSSTASEVLHLQFGFPDACRPQDLGLSEDTRLLSVGFLELTVS